jgi:putative endopeptidase
VTETSPARRPAIDFSTFDESIRIQDDLFRHVNGSWLNTTEIPADKPLTGAFMDLRDKAEAAVRDIITTLGGWGAWIGRGPYRRLVRQLHG